MTTDPIADLITSIRNAGAVSKDSVSVPYSNVKHAIASKLNKEGYLGAVDKQSKGEHGVLVIELLYTDGTHRITGIERVSKPGRRIYKKAGELRPFKQGVGQRIISTPQGILTDAEARKAGIGGEVLLNVW